VKLEEFRRNLNKPRALAVFTSVVLLFGLLNIGLSNFYLSKILTSIESSEEIMETANAKLKNKYPLLNTEQVLNNIRIVVRDARSALEVENYKLNSINVNMMGTEFKPAIKAFTEHSNSWVDYYKRLEACTTVECFISELEKPNQITPTFRIAEEAFKRVIPILDLVDAEQRIADEFRN